MVADKFTGAPRGFCFAEFATIADAAKVLHTFNVSRKLVWQPAARVRIVLRPHVSQHEAMCGSSGSPELVDSISSCGCATCSAL